MPINLLTLQQRLETIYDIRTDCDVKRFVFHDPDCYRTLHPSITHANCAETLLISPTSDGIELSLYLDAATLQTLNADNPFDSLHSGNLNPFCIVAEGISHFVYLVWNAARERPVTQLELELQAEIDKYILCVSLLAAQHAGRLPQDLCTLLFDRVSFHRHLNPGQKRRYVLANRYARQYCRHLHQRLLQFGESVAVTKEIRRFYRLWHAYKFRRIESMA